MKKIPHASEISLSNLLSQFSVMPLDQLHEQNNVKEKETEMDRGLSLIEVVDGIRPRTSDTHVAKKDLRESSYSRVK